MQIACSLHTYVSAGQTISRTAHADGRERAQRQLGDSNRFLGVRGDFGQPQQSIHVGWLLQEKITQMVAAFLLSTCPVEIDRFSDFSRVVACRQVALSSIALDDIDAGFYPLVLRTQVLVGRDFPPQLWDWSSEDEREAYGSTSNPLNTCLNRSHSRASSSIEDAREVEFDVCSILHNRQGTNRVARDWDSVPRSTLSLCQPAQ
jgi:hypothetical protein